MAEITAEQQKSILRIKRCSPTAYYDILDLESVKTTCTPTQIKKAYYKLSLLLHPDKNKHPDAPEAFNKVLKAFEILSDPELRKQHDLTGGDPKSRFGGASASATGRAPFENVFNRQHHHRGAAAGGFEGVDITPEELFRQFFGGADTRGPFGGGPFGGGGGPFGQSFVFNMGGPGIRVNTFPGGGGQQRRQRTATTGNDEARQTSGLSFGSLQILIFLIYLLVSAIGYLFPATGAAAHPGFRFDAASPPYTSPHLSHRLEVPYWVNPAETVDLTRKKWREFDRYVEGQYMSKLETECLAEQNYRDQLIQEAQGWFFPDEEKMKKARAYPMPACKKLREMRSR